MTYQFSSWRYSRPDNSLIDVTVTLGGDVFPFTYGGPGDGVLSDIIAAYIADQSPTIAAYVAPTQTAEEVQAALVKAVKDEAQRRIIELTGATSLQDAMIKQLNASMRANILNDLRHDAALTAEQQAEADALRTLAAGIQAIRDASDVIEAMDPIPLDYDDDSYWP